MIYFAILSTFFSSVATISWKQALKYNAPKEIFNLLSKSTIFLVGLTLYFFGLLDFSGVTSFYVFLLILITITGTIKTVVMQRIYTKEKISTLMPYTNINKILSIILAFFLFGNISTISFIITLIAISVIILFTIDFKSLKVPKTIRLFSSLEIIESIITLITGYILLQITGSAFFVLTYIIGSIYMGLIVAHKGLYKEFRNLPVKFYAYRLTACHLGGTSYLLSVIVIKNLGLSVSILLSFIGIGITLFFSYIFLKDKPSKKNIALTIIVSTLVGIGYILS